jgi:hypothetical protein
MGEGADPISVTPTNEQLAVMFDPMHRASGANMAA